MNKRNQPFDVPRSKTRGLLRVDTERYSSPHPKGWGFAPSKYQDDEADCTHLFFLSLSEKTSERAKAVVKRMEAAVEKIEGAAQQTESATKKAKQPAKKSEAVFEKRIMK